MKAGTLILRLNVQVAVIKLNALYNSVTGTFLVTDEDGNIITDENEIQITGS